MSDSEQAILERAGEPVELLLYDYFKHLTTLSLVALGGVLGIADARGIERDALAMVVLSIGLGGGVALMALNTIARAKIAGRTMPASLRWYRLLSGGLFSFGVGMFLTLFLRAI